MVNSGLKGLRNSLCELISKSQIKKEKLGYLERLPGILHTIKLIEWS